MSTAQTARHNRERTADLVSGPWEGTLAALALVLGMALALRTRPLLAAWHVNLGALQQARAELALYDASHADDPTLDAVRRQIDLSVAEARYQQALDLDPGHAIARMQLAQIALSRGHYVRALDHARAAWEAGHRDWRTRMTLGDALVATGQVERGVELVRALPRAEARFQCWAYYRHMVTGEYRQAADAYRAVVLLNPENKGAAQFVQVAESKIKEP